MPRSQFDQELNKMHVDLDRMCHLVVLAIENCVTAFKEQDYELARDIIHGDKQINDVERSIEAKCLSLILKQQPVASDLRDVSTALKVVTDLERIGDQSADIAELILEMKEMDSFLMIGHIQDMAKIATKMVKESLDAFHQHDLKHALEVKKMDNKMDELFEISDRITVLRDGQYVFSKKTKDLCPNDLIKAMVGREITEIYPESKSKIGEVILKVKHASRKGEFKKIDFELRKGEKLGIAGLMGAGRTELMMAVFGAAKLEEGEIEIGGVPVRIQSPKDAIRQKIALVTEDRKRYGLNLTASVEDNAVSVIESSLSKFGFYRRKLGRKAAEEMISRMNTKVTGMDQIVGSLSGGNMQKVVLSKWLLNDPDIIIFDEPTRGIDVGAKAEIYKIIEELACKGKGIIIISSEMPELIGLSQRIIVLHEGEQTGELRGKEMTQENIMTLASGYRKEEKE